MYILINTYFDIIFRMTWDTCYFYGSKWDLITTANSFKCQLQVKENFKIMTVLYLFTIIILNTTQAAMQLYVYLQQCIATDLLPFDNKNAECRAVHLNVTLIWYAKSNICTNNIANCVYTIDARSCSNFLILWLQFYMTFTKTLVDKFRIMMNHYFFFCSSSKT